MNGTWFLDFPAWRLETLGGGFWIALIATFHVFIALFAIGGGLFLVLTEHKGYREKSRAILDYTRSHARFFLWITTVLGAVSGVGIWFTIMLLAPAATRILVGEFLFAWASEWAFFLAEVISLFAYVYSFGRVKPKRHLTIGWIYFAFAWLSLFAVNGIVSFMLTPGDWIHTGSFMDGFFNPTFWPSLAFRSLFAVLAAGLFALVTATAVRDERAGRSLCRWAAGWVILGTAGAVLTGLWYAKALPPDLYAHVFRKSPEIAAPLRLFWIVTPLLLAGGALMSLRLPRSLKRSGAVVLLVLGLAGLGSFEWIREAGRRPWIIQGVVYGNSLAAGDVAAARTAGALASARWKAHDRVTDANRLDAGRELFHLYCGACHSIGGPLRDIRTLSAGLTRTGLAGLLSALDTVSDVMPPFPGNQAERDALAAFLTEGMGRPEAPDVALPPPALAPAEPAAFDANADPYVLLAWTGQGMYCLSDADRLFSTNLPGVDLHAVLIRRGPVPDIITEGVIVRYRLEEGFRRPSSQVDFWAMSAALTGAAVAPDVGISGRGTEGVMDFDATRGSKGEYLATDVPAVPYDAEGRFRPYPLAEVEAVDAGGNVVAATRLTMPVSTEMNCRLCHGGPWRKDGRAGLSDETARNILAAHDRLNGTDLGARAVAGNPQRCQSCHHETDATRLNLSAAIHGFHAHVTGDLGGKTCAACHPGWPTGTTRSFRGVHKTIGLDCAACHGEMQDHALGLLTTERDREKTGAVRLMAGLANADAKIPGRRPWVNLPDCLACHVEFRVPEDSDALHRWTPEASTLFRNATDAAGLPCMACHGSTHALRPSRNPLDPNRDNLAPLQYQGNPYPMGANGNCRVCHTVDMEDEGHHPNVKTPFRNTAME